ncbi:LysR family transcriptional regulator [Nocardia sp. NBC_01503]|uniref:LysR family transcriptional regulator n=1 Tax=Nocardia sp. NBC_01503 TaxID=2975997 RepID=UPI002E7B2D8C|nr:LysR family transcriptional regulator [Nocardia sp. NBC_01503]WTL32214.1 LysR family transcriptional regulator [Nocardia sp. NBC_01503]
MELYEIEGFLAVAEHLHFGRAAEQLHVSPSRVSQTITQLERRIGAQLFERTTRRVVLTRIGERLLSDLRPGHEQIQRGIRRAVGAGRGFEGTLTVGFIGAAAGQLCHATAALFRAEHPETEISIRDAQLTDGLSWFTTGFDMVLVSRPIDDPALVHGPALITEPRVLAVSAGHPLATRQTVELEDLAAVTLLDVPESVPQSWVRDHLPTHTPAGRPIPRGRLVHTFQEVLASIGAGEGAFICGAQVNRFYQRPDIAFLPITGTPPMRWGFTWRACDETARIRAFDTAAHGLVRAELKRANRT